MEINLYVASAQPFVYQVRPILSVVTAERRVTVGMPELSNTIAAAALTQFTCHQLTGNKTFKVAWSGGDAIDEYARSQDGAWCAQRGV